jgi:hypothetical protein
MLGPPRQPSVIREENEDVDMDSDSSDRLDEEDIEKSLVSTFSGRLIDFTLISMTLAARRCIFKRCS